MKLGLLRSRVIRVDGFLLVLLLGSLAGNVYLGAGRTGIAGNAPARPQLLAAGSKAPAFQGHDLTGGAVSLAYDTSKAGTLLYVFSPTCHWCERNRANIQAIAKARPDLRIIGVALSGDSSQLAGPNPFHQIVRPSQQTVQAYGFAGTPSTVLVSSEGVILKAWSGAYNGSVATDVSRALAVTLPGLLQE